MCRQEWRVTLTWARAATSLFISSIYLLLCLWWLSTHVFHYEVAAFLAAGFWNLNSWDLSQCFLPTVSCLSLGGSTLLSSSSPPRHAVVFDMASVMPRWVLVVSLRWRSKQRCMLHVDRTHVSVARPQAVEAQAPSDHQAKPRLPVLICSAVASLRQMIETAAPAFLCTTKWTDKQAAPFSWFSWDSSFKTPLRKQRWPARLLDMFMVQTQLREEQIDAGLHSDSYYPNRRMMMGIICHATQL